MAVTAVALKENWADETVDEVKYTELWQVLTNSRTDGAATVLLTAAIPQIQSPYSGNVVATCKRRSPRLASADETMKKWIVTVEYSTKSGDDDDPNDNQSPLNRPAKWSGSFQQFQTIAEKDRDDKAILNTAGDAFDPPLTKDDSRPVISCVKNFASLNLSTWTEWRDAINSSAFGPFAAKTVKVMNISWVEKFDDSPNPYYEVTFSFSINPDTWDDEVLNRGYRQIEAEGEEPKTITVDSDVGKVAISEPALLDPFGGVIAKVNLPEGAHFVTAKKYKLRNFATLGIPNPGVKS